MPFRLLILGAVAAAAVGLATAVLLPNDMVATPLVEDRVALTFLAIWTVGAVPLAFAMPLVQGRFLGRMWRAPRLAYVVPRWIVGLLLSMIIAQVVASIAVAVLRDCRIFWLAGSQMLVGGAFGAGAWLRFRHRSDAEWGVRWWPRI